MLISKKKKSFVIPTCILSLLLLVSIVSLTVISCSDDKKGPGPGEISAGPGEISAGPGEISAGPGEIVAGPGGFDFKEIKGSGNIKTREFNVSNFNKVEVSGEGVLVIEQGDVVSLDIETDDNLFEYVKVSVSGEILKIETLYGEGYDLVPTDSIYYYLKFKDLEELKLPGAVTVKCDNLQLSKLDLDMSGVADVEVAGEINIINISVDGVGNLKCGNLSSTDCSINGDGNAHITISVNGKLDINFTGIGTIKYSGDPEVNKNIGKLVDVERID